MSAANLREHWAKKRRREKLQAGAVKYALSPSQSNLTTAKSIELIRLSPRKLDSDNLAYAFKHIRDAVADILVPGKAAGQSDRDLNFSYSQQSSKEYAIIIRFS